MSRFFARGGSDSETSSSDEELYGTSEEEESQSQASSSEEESESEQEESDEDEELSGSDEEEAGAIKPGYYMRSQFLKGGEEREDEDEGRRVVKSAKDKLLDEIDASIKSIDNAKKINDWTAISSDFDKLNKLAERSQKQYSIVPTSYIKALVELETAIAETTQNEKTAKKKMNALNSKALNTVKQRLRKISKDHDSKITSYKADPEAFEDGNVSSAAGTPAPVAKPKVSAIPTTVVAGDDDEGFATVGKGGKALQLTPENVFKTLLSIIESRGKKNTDRASQIKTLETLTKVAAGNPYQLINVLLMLIPIRFDLTASGSVMPTALWKAAEADIRSLFEVLETHPEYRVIESASEPEDLEKGPEAGPDGVKEIAGSVSSLIERLDDELTRALQVIDPHTTEYVDRLRDEASLYDLMIRGQIYLENNLKGSAPQESAALCRLLVRRLDHVYFKPTSVIITTEKVAWSAVPASLRSKLTPRIAEETSLSDKEYTVSLINSICSVLYQQTNTVYRTKAMLSHIYHYALNDYYFKARDMFLMSHLQSTIHTADPTVLVLFNRALVQVGLCAFRLGLISECQQSLQEICSSSRLKELLGQGVTKYNQATGPDRQRLLPFHMHINLELLECVYLTASLLIEVPYMASISSSIDAKKKVVSKPFRRILDYHERQVFTGPPENTRDHIMQGAKALLNGDWVQARELLTSVKIWSLMANADEIKDMLSEKLQEEGLRTYLFSYGSCYQSLKLPMLAKLFQLEERRVASLVSKMIANEEIAAALDQKTNSVVFRQGVELTRLQVLALALAEKTVQLAERNERLATGGHQLTEPSGSLKQSSGSTARGQQQNRQSNTNRPQQQRAVRA